MIENTGIALDFYLPETSDFYAFYYKMLPHHCMIIEFFDLESERRNEIIVKKQKKPQISSVSRLISTLWVSVIFSSGRSAINTDSHGAFDKNTGDEMLQDAQSEATDIESIVFVIMVLTMSGDLEDKGTKEDLALINTAGSTVV